MGVISLIKGIGQGSLFGYSRYFGVHNPFDSKLGKAGDPFLNTFSLRKIQNYYLPLTGGGEKLHSAMRNAIRDTLVYEEAEDSYNAWVINSRAVNAILPINLAIRINSRLTTMRVLRKFNPYYLNAAITLADQAKKNGTSLPALLLSFA